MTIKGSLHGASPIVKRFSAENFLRQNRYKMAVFQEEGLNVKFLFSNPEKAHPCTEPRCLALRVKIGSGV